MVKTCFVVDSMSTFNQTLINKDNIRILKYAVDSSDNKLIYDNFTDDQKLKILNEIENEKINYRTSFLSSYNVEKYFDEYLKEFEKIIYICAADGYTGQFENIKQLMTLDKYKDRLWIFNSYSIASTIETQLYLIMQKIEENPNITYNEIADYLDDISRRSIILFSPKNLIGMINSGRVPLILIKLMKITKIHPVIKCEEKNKATGIIFRKWNEVCEKLCEGLNKIFNKKINKDTIEKIYFYSSILSEQDINNYIDFISKFFNIDKNIIELRTTPLPVIVYTLKDSIGIGLTLKKDNYKY